MVAVSAISRALAGIGSPAASATARHSSYSPRTMVAPSSVATIVPTSARSRQVDAASVVRKVYLIHCSWPIASLATWSTLACTQAAASASTRALAPVPSRSPKVSLAAGARCSTAPSAALVALMKHRPPSTASRPKRASSAA
ncbi:hypothetical protein D3C72_1845060 [compost metagenome]